jgi:hypothetical protein
MEYLIALIALTALEIVLGIDNIVFIATVQGPSLGLSAGHGHAALAAVFVVLDSRPLPGAV